MKKFLKLFVTIIFLSLITGCADEKIELKDDFNVKISFNNKCDSNNIDYYYNDDNKIFINCINNITLYDEKNTYELIESIKSDSKYYDLFYSKIKEEYKYISSMYDGGTSIYEDETGNITIALCNTMNGNKNIYIGLEKIDQDKYNKVCSN